MIETARTLLFAPGDDERKLAKAFAGDADGVIADLEDAVAPGRKQAARERVRAALREAPRLGPLRLVRVVNSDPEDAALARELPLDALVLPKATPESAAEIAKTGTPVVALVETAVALRYVHEIAATPGVIALMLGTLDLAAELGLEPLADDAQLIYARSLVVAASAAAGIRAPFDGVHSRFQDLSGLRAETERARALGFGGKACIHPRQLDVVARCFRPTEQELAWARDVLARFGGAAEEGSAVVAAAGEMVDRPVVLRAQRILQDAERSS